MRRVLATQDCAHCAPAAAAAQRLKVTAKLSHGLRAARACLTQAKLGRFVSMLCVCVSLGLVRGNAP